MTTKPPFAPGCWGSALSFAKDEICGACQYSKDCEVVHVKALAALRKHLGIDTTKRTRRSNALTKRAEEVLKGTGKTVEQIRESLLGGVNPFPIKTGFLGIVCHVLLRREEVTVAFMETMLETHSGLSKASASAYVGYSQQILSHCNALAQSRSGALRLARG